jgi:hypothetical protein
MIIGCHLKGSFEYSYHELTVECKMKRKIHNHHFNYTSLHFSINPLTIHEKLNLIASTHQRKIITDQFPMTTETKTK